MYLMHPVYVRAKKPERAPAGNKISSTGQWSPYTIDILVIGSKNGIDQAKVQRETWASHPAVRHFFLSTEYDDVDPECTNGSPWSRKELKKAVMPCKLARKSWRDLGSNNKMTDKFIDRYGKVKWLEKKADPKGWLCVQRRFVTSFTNVLELYAETRSLPDYFILADDDTYVNIDHIVKQMITEPEKLEAKGIDQGMMMFPTSNTPVVTAGCRVRKTDNEGAYTYPFGGYGSFFSRGSLEQLIQPLHCKNDDGASESGVTKTMNNQQEHRSCEKLLNKTRYSYPMSATIAEENFFNIGDSLNQVFYKYSREVQHFCIHSDWFVGYIANFHNISRHTPNVTGNVFDETKMDVEEHRLHHFKDSEVYGHVGGFCKYGDIMPCVPGATVCHRMNITSFRNIHSALIMNRK